MRQQTKKRFISQYVPIAEGAQDNFQQLIDSFGNNTVKQGTVVKGVVIQIAGNNTKKVIVVDVGLGADGRIPAEEFSSSADAELPKEGDIVEVYVTRIEGRGGRTILSRKQAILEQSWDKFVQKWKNEEHVEGIIFERCKGGFKVQLEGLCKDNPAFLPGSQVDVRAVKDISSIMDIPQPFKIINMSQKDNNIVVSRKAILEESRSEAKKEMLATIKEGMILEGLVKNITAYGAFIDLGSLDALLHLTDMAWSRINHPSEMLVIGQKVKVIVTKFNEENKRISVGLKQLDNNPWESIKEEFPVGTKMRGKVTNFVEYGAFVELKEGIEGLVHSSEISWIKANQNPKKSLTIGQEVEFMVLEIDTQKPRISLSIRQCQENPYIQFAENHQAGSEIKGSIKNINDFGVTVSLENELDGFIHESELGVAAENKSEALKNYKKGEEIECIILSVEVEKEKIRLRAKVNEMPEDNTSPLNQFKKNTTITCHITAIENDGIEVELSGTDETLRGFIKKTDLAIEKAEQKPERFRIGDKVDAKVIATDKKLARVLLSIKALEQDEKTKAIKNYGSTDSGASLGDILGAVMEEGIGKK